MIYWLTPTTYIDSNGIIRNLAGMSVTGNLTVGGYISTDDYVYVGEGLATGGGALAKIGRGQAGGNVVSIRPTDSAGDYQNDRELKFDPDGANLWSAEGGFRSGGNLEVTSGGMTVTGDATFNDDVNFNGDILQQLAFRMIAPATATGKSLPHTMGNRWNDANDEFYLIPGPEGTFDYGEQLVYKFNSEAWRFNGDVEMGGSFLQQLGANFKAPGIEASHASAHEMGFRWTGANDAFYLLPAPEGTFDYSLELGFNFATELWEINGKEILVEGSHGIGETIRNYTSTDDLDDLSHTEFFGNPSVSSVPANAPESGQAHAGINVRLTSVRGFQLVGIPTSGNLHFRIKNTTWGSWQEIWTSDNFDPTDYAALAGATFTGAVTFNDDLNLGGLLKCSNQNVSEFVAPDVASGATTAHEVRWRWNNADDQFGWTPYPEGSAAWDKQWGYDFTNTRYFWEAAVYFADDAEFVGAVTFQDVLKITPGSAPSSPSAGWVYFDSSTNKLRCYDGTTWNDMF